MRLSISRVSGTRGVHPTSPFSFVFLAAGLRTFKLRVNSGGAIDDKTSRQASPAFDFTIGGGGGGALCFTKSLMIGFGLWSFGVHPHRSSFPTSPYTLCRIRNVSSEASASSWHWVGVSDNVIQCRQAVEYNLDDHLPHSRSGRSSEPGSVGTVSGFRKRDGSGGAATNLDKPRSSLAEVESSTELSAAEYG